MNDYFEKPEIKVSDRVRVPNGEIGTVGDVFFKDGEWRVVVDFDDKTWITVSPLDVEKVRRAAK